jgi:acyl dehydratase
VSLDDIGGIRGVYSGFVAMTNYASAVLSILKKQMTQGGRVRVKGGCYPSLVVSAPEISLNPSHIQQYKDVCGYRNNAGIPLMYPAMLCSTLQMKLMTMEEFPFPLLGLVHLANSIEQFEIIDPSQKVRIEISLDENIIHHEKGYCCNISGKIFSVDKGNLLWKTGITLLCRAKPETPLGAVLYESQIKQSDVEDTQEIERWTLSSGLGRDYAAVSGDYNPIHLSAPSAYLFGFRSGAIIHGMWTKARSLATLMPPIEELQKLNGDPSLPIASAYTEFKTPLFIPSTAALCSKIVPKESSGGMTSRLFEVKGTTGEMLPYMRGRCAWRGEGGK